MLRSGWKKEGEAGLKPGAYPARLGNGAGGGEELLGAGTDANVFGEIFPADGAGAVEEEFGGT